MYIYRTGTILVYISMLILILILKVVSTNAIEQLSCRVQTSCGGVGDLEVADLKDTLYPPAGGAFDWASGTLA